MPAPVVRAINVDVSRIRGDSRVASVGSNTIFNQYVEAQRISFVDCGYIWL